MANLGLPREYSDIPKPFLQINDGVVFANDFPAIQPSSYKEVTNLDGRPWIVLGAGKEDLTFTEQWDYNFKTRSQAPLYASNFIVPEDGVYDVNGAVSIWYENQIQAAVELQEFTLLVVANLATDGFDPTTGTPSDAAAQLIDNTTTEPIWQQRLHANRVDAFVVCTDTYARQRDTYNKKTSGQLTANCTTYLQKGDVLTFMLHVQLSDRVNNPKFIVEDFYASVSMQNRNQIFRIYQGVVKSGPNRFFTDAERPVPSMFQSQTF